MPKRRQITTLEAARLASEKRARLSLLPSESGKQQLEKPGHNEVVKKAPPRLARRGHVSLAPKAELQGQKAAFREVFGETLSDEFVDEMLTQLHSTLAPSHWARGRPMSDMKRREFITLLGGAAVAWPLEASAQQPRLPTIGFLGAATASVWGSWTTAFEQRLRELGWTEGRTIAIEYRWAEGRPERYAEIAAEFVRRKVVVIVTAGSAVPAVKQATSVIPIVFALAGDPVGAGLVASLARPGGNVTGLSNQQSDLASKRIELLRDVLPNLRRPAILE